MERNPHPSAQIGPVPLFDFRIHFTADDRAMLAVRGELDLACVVDLTWVLDRLSDLQVRFIGIDARAVTFIDCAALEVLLAARHRVRAYGADLEVVHPCDALVRLLEMTGSEGLLSTMSPEADTGR